MSKLYFILYAFMLLTIKSKAQNPIDSIDYYKNKMQINSAIDYALKTKKK